MAEFTDPNWNPFNFTGSSYSFFNPNTQQSRQVGGQEFRNLVGPGSQEEEEEEPTIGAGIQFPAMPSMSSLLARQRQQQGIMQLDDLYTSYLDAVESATGFVNAEITREISNADLRGIQYEITDEMKTKRISDYFATVWGAGQQARLESLIGEWGEPEGFDGFPVERGDPSVYESTPGGEPESVSTSIGTRPTILAQEDDETLGARSSVLGG